MKQSLHKAIWRSRAVAIIGALIMLLAIFQGLPGALKGTLFVIFGLLTFAFGFAGSRHKSYVDETKPVVIEAVEVIPEVAEESVIPLEITEVTVVEE